MDRQTLKNILVASGEFTTEENVDNLLRHVNHGSALVDCVKTTLERENLGNVDMVMTTYDKQLCLKFSGWNTAARKARLDDILNHNFCESLALVKETKTTMVYAM